MTGLAGFLLLVGGVAEPAGLRVDDRDDSKAGAAGSVLRMPTVKPRIPGPVPIPEVAPRTPGPVPMPEVGPPGTLLVPSPQSRSRPLPEPSAVPGRVWSEDGRTGR